MEHLEQLDVRQTEIQHELRENSFVLLRGLVSRQQARAVLQNLWKFVDSQDFVATGAGSRDLVRSNSVKWSVGGSSASQSNLARVMATVYNPLNADDVIGAHSLFRSLILVRELCVGRSVPLEDGNLPDGFFNATRVQIYPKGGGFMGAHVDSSAKATFSRTGAADFLQPLVLLTERGTDFEQGGAYVMSSEGVVQDIEALAQSGDIVLYDERSTHGVADIDPMEVFASGPLRGRAVALATIYS